MKCDGLLVRRAAIGRKTTQNVLREAASLAKTSANVASERPACFLKLWLDGIGWAAVWPRRESFQPWAARDGRKQGGHSEGTFSEVLARLAASRTTFCGFATDGRPPHEEAVVFYETCAKPTNPALQVQWFWKHWPYKNSDSLVLDITKIMKTTFQVLRFECFFDCRPYKICVILDPALTKHFIF